MASVWLRATDACTRIERCDMAMVVVILWLLAHTPIPTGVWHAAGVFGPHHRRRHRLLNQAHRPPPSIPASTIAAASIATTVATTVLTNALASTAIATAISNATLATTLSATSFKEMHETARWPKAAAAH